MGDQAPRLSISSVPAVISSYNSQALQAAAEEPLRVESRLPVKVTANNLSPSASVQDIASLEGGLRKPTPQKHFVSAAILSLTIFALLNLYLSAIYGDDSHVKGKASDSNRDLWSGAGSIDITVNNFRSLREAPTVVLLGSSLIMHPFWSMDAELGDVGDIFHHHESLVLAHDLGVAGFKAPRVYSFAVFGEMISDAYIYVNDFLKGAKTPKLVMFGIAPRDFSDADLPSPTASFTFKRLVGLKNFDRYVDDYMPGMQERGDFIASHTCYLFGKRWRLQHETCRAVNKFFARFGIKGDTAVSADESTQHPGFMLGGTRDERFILSSEEYKRRYRGIGEKDISLQKSFLSKTLATCNDRGIKVVLVNMPLTQTNRNLLPLGFYDDYRTSITAIASRYKCTEFLDLGDSNIFKDHDYWDTAHLNNLGGHKLLNCIEPAILKGLRAK